MTTLPACSVDEPLEYDHVDLRQARRIAALLDRDAAELREGDDLPPGWHFALFTPTDRQKTLRSDGYIAASAGGLAELADLEVMLGGRRTNYRKPLPLGAPVCRRSSTVSLARKEGRSGAITFVTRRQEIFLGSQDEPAIIEEEDFLYRQASSQAGGPRSDTPAAALPGYLHRASFHPDETRLFRYSALSFNAHRIHFDLPYARDVAGFPALVVNGGLIALSLLDLFRRQLGHIPKAVSTRSRKALFCGRPATLLIQGDAEGWILSAFDDRNDCAMEMTIR